MFMEERQNDIIRKVNQTGRILISEIQEGYQILADCARRDLKILESKGLLQRTHGGAIAVNPKEIYPASAYNPIDIKELLTDYFAVEKNRLNIFKTMMLFILLHL